MANCRHSLVRKLEHNSIFGQVIPGMHGIQSCRHGTAELAWLARICCGNEMSGAVCSIWWRWPAGLALHLDVGWVMVMSARGYNNNTMEIGRSFDSFVTAGDVMVYTGMWHRKQGHCTVLVRRSSCAHPRQQELRTRNDSTFNSTCRLLFCVA